LKQRSLAVVVQRYGADITGGSETLAREVSEHLASEMAITVFTSCARDYVTWRNELPEGEEERNGVRILRFRAEEERDLAAFNRYSEALYLKSPTEEEQLLWLRRQGPYVPRLVEALRAQKDGFDAFLFFTYLYYPTYAGLEVCPERSILVPTAHDEPPLRFSIYDTMFALPRAFAFCSGPEETLVRSRFAIAAAASAVTGIGIDVPQGRPLEPPILEGRYFLYAGRIDAGKGCAAMVESYRAYRARHPEGPALALIGKLSMDLPGDLVTYLGYRSEAEKAALMAGADVILCPSPYESLSITLLEGFACGVPALANAASPVLKDHCVRSNGGLYYQTGAEFVEALDLLARAGDLRRTLGENGRAYVGREYTWPRVLGRYKELIEKAATT
jgi:glycosyltransferase involved in cell wall biosynthesis